MKKKKKKKGVVCLSTTDQKKNLFHLNTKKSFSLRVDNNPKVLFIFPIYN